MHCEEEARGDEHIECLVCLSATAALQARVTRGPYDLTKQFHADLRAPLSHDCHGI